MRDYFSCLAILFCVVALFMGRGYCAVEDAPLDSAGLLRCRNSMMEALRDNRLDDLKRIVEKAEKLNKTTERPLFYDSEKLLVKYFLKDFEFLSNVDSVALYNTSTMSLYYIDEKKAVKGFYDNFYFEIKDKMAEELQSGKLVKTLDEIENESDRAFVFILLVGLYESKVQVSSLIEERKALLSNRKQLDYLVGKYWTDIFFDNNKRRWVTLGALFGVYAGDISDKVENSIGFNIGWGRIREKILYGVIFDFQKGDYAESDSLYFFDAGLELNAGYAVYRRGFVSLYGLVNAGGRFNSLQENDDVDKKRKLPYQFYPAFGAGMVLDFCEPNIEIGLRYRSGVESVWADDVVKASGFRFYFSIELLLAPRERKPFEYDD